MVELTEGDMGIDRRYITDLKIHVVRDFAYKRRHVLARSVRLRA